MTINGSTNNSAWTYKLEVTETSTSVANKTSTIQVKTYLGRANSTSYLGGEYSVSINCAGQEETKSGTISYPTYISGGDWLELKTFTFIVSNTSNPTTINISSSFNSVDFTPSYASASGSMALTILHLPPEINTATMVETNQAMITLGVPDTTIVRHLSKKTITLSATAYDSATLKYRLRHLNTDYNIPSATTFQNSATFNTDYTQNDIAIGSGKANIIQDVGDSLDGLTTDWVQVNISGTTQKPNGIAYSKPSLERTSTTIKRKSGNGTNLTDNKANINVVGTIYKENDIIGNNNSVTQLGYKVWEDGTSEPANYTSLTPTISGGDVTVTNYEISNVNFTKIYNYKIILIDAFGYNYVVEGTIPLGQPTWTEYKDRVDFLKLTVKGYNPFEYSENETICGEWLGKPLYRKMIIFDSNIVSGLNTKAHNISNVNVIFVNQGKSFMFAESSGLSYPFPINQYNSATNFDRVGINVDRTNVTIISEGNWGSLWEAYVTIEYTKTID